MIEWNLEDPYGPIPYISDTPCRMPVFSDLCRVPDLRRQKDIPVTEEVAEQAFKATAPVTAENVGGPEIDIGGFVIRNQFMCPNSPILLEMPQYP